MSTTRRIVSTGCSIGWRSPRRVGYQQAEAIAPDALDADDVGLARAIHWDTYFGADEDRHDPVGVPARRHAERVAQARRFAKAAEEPTQLGACVVSGHAA